MLTRLVFIRVVLPICLVVGELRGGREGYRRALVGSTLESRVVEGWIGFVMGRELMERLHNVRPAPRTAKMRISGWRPRMRELCGWRVVGVLRVVCVVLVRVVRVRIRVGVGVGVGVRVEGMSQPLIALIALILILILEPGSVGRVHWVVVGGVMRGMRGMRGVRGMRV
jgi:hypothetical protein